MLTWYLVKESDRALRTDMQDPRRNVAPAAGRKPQGEIETEISIETTTHLLVLTDTLLGGSEEGAGGEITSSDWEEILATMDIDQDFAGRLLALRRYEVTSTHVDLAGDAVAVKSNPIFLDDGWTWVDATELDLTTAAHMKKLDKDVLRRNARSERFVLSRTGTVLPMSDSDTIRVVNPDHVANMLRATMDRVTEVAQR